METMRASDTGNSSFCSQSCGSWPSVFVREMDKVVDDEDRQDKGCKNKRKLAHPSILPASFPSSLIEFPQYELPVSQNGLSDLSPSQVWSHLFRDEEPERYMHEVVDWNDPIARQLEELLLSNLQAIFRSALKQVVELGFDEKLVEKSLSRKALYVEEGDPVSNIVRQTVNVLKGKDDIITDFVFENFQHLLHYTMVEMVSVVREVRPSLTVGEAMWVLLICDLNLPLACAVEDRLNVACNGERTVSSSCPQSKSEVRSSDIVSNCSSQTFQKDLSTNHQNQKSEEPKFGSFLNSPDNQSPHASGGVKLKAENASLPITAEKSSGTAAVPAQECKSGPYSKRHNRKEIAVLRQKFLHMEKAYRACGRGNFKSGKIASVSGLVVEKRLKPPSETPNQQMKCGSSTMISTKGVHSADAACHVSIGDASVLPAGDISGTLPTKDTISTPMVNANTSAPGKLSKSKPELSFSAKILDYCAGIPFDEALGKYVPRDEKDGLILKFISRVQELQDELQGWNNWTNQKVMQVTNRLGKLQGEFKTLRKEKQDADLLKKDKKTVAENAMKRISEMENAMESTKRQIENAASATVTLETEKYMLKQDLAAAKLWVEKSMKSHQQALEREQMALKEAQSWESQNSLLRDELEKEKNKLVNLQQELHREKNLQAKVEGKLARERTAKEKILAQAASIKKEKEELEERAKSEEDMVRKKAASDLQKYVEDIGKLEKELVDLKLKSDSEKIAALRETNDGFSRATKSTPNKKGNKKSDRSQAMVGGQDKLAARRLRQEHECVMCLSEEMSVVFLPCAHQVVCPGCNELHEKQGMKECPSCRTPIQRRVLARFVGH